jgi:hypothetical protein
VRRIPDLEHRALICGVFEVTGIGCLLFAAVSSWS